MQTYNSFNELATAQTTTPAVSQMSVFNADFAGVQRLTPEQLKEIQPFMDAVNEAERKFREEYDKVDSPEAKRRLAKHFENNIKAKLEAPMKEYGVTVSWDEPPADAGHIDRVA